jgi:PAS domain S-box-containing protein
MALTFVVIPLIAAALVSAGVAVAAWQRRPAHGAVAFATMMVAIAVWTAGYALELVADTLSTKVLWAKVEYLGIAFVPIAWFIFAVRYSRQSQWPRWPILTGLSIVPILTLILTWTNEGHGLMWSSLALDSSNVILTLNVSHGAWFWVHTVYSYVLLLIGTLAIVRSLQKSAPQNRNQIGMLLIGAFAPWVGNLLYLLQINPLPYLDLTPFAFTISGLALAQGLLRFRLLAILPKAHEAVIENTDDLVFVIDQHDHLIYANPAFQQALGRPAAELLGQPLDQIFGNLPELLNNYRHTLKAEAEVTIGDGPNRRYYDLRISPLHHQDQLSGRLAIARDITQHRQAESTLQTQKQLLEHLVAVARAAAEGTTLDETLQNVVQEAARLTGAERGSLLMLAPDGRYITRSILIRGQTQQVEELNLARRVLGHGLAAWIVRERKTALIADAVQDDRWLTLPNQPYIATSVLGVPILSAATLVGVLILTHSAPDIFTEEQARLLEAAADQIALTLRNAQIYDEQRRLAERQATLYTVLRAVGGQLDPETVASQAVETIARLTGWAAVSILVPDDSSTQLAVHATTLPVEKDYKVEIAHSVIGRAYRTAQTQTVQDVAVDPDYVSGPVPASSQLAVPLRSGAHLLGVLNIDSQQAGAFDDEAVLLATSLADAIGLALENANLYKESLSTADRLRELGQLKSAFLANMSHELRTPLQAIMGYTEVLLEDARELGKPRMLADLKKIENAASHLQMLINDTLDLSKIEAGRMKLDPETFHVRSLVDNVAATIQPLALKGENILQVDCPENLPPMYADPTRVRQILINLLGNAAKFTTKGRITLTVTTERLGESGQWLNFGVADTGIGMSPEQMQHLFEEFQQGDVSVSRKYGGTGLGLALSRRLCQIMGGDISVTSQAGHGSIFVARLPLRLNRQASEAVMSVPSDSEMKPHG